MQYRLDGDQMMICADSFVNLQESPAIFISLDSELAKAILAERSSVNVNVYNDHFRPMSDTWSKYSKVLGSNG